MSQIRRPLRGQVQVGLGEPALTQHLHLFGSGLGSEKGLIREPAIGGLLRSWYKLIFQTNGTIQRTAMMMIMTRTARKLHILDKLQSGFPALPAARSIPQMDGPWSLPFVCSGQGWQTFPVKSHPVNSSGFVTPSISLLTTLLSHEPYTYHTCIMSWLCSNKPLFTGTEIWTSYDFLVSGDRSLLFLFFQSFKNNQNHSQLTQKQVTSQLWPMGCGLPPLAEGRFV